MSKATKCIIIITAIIVIIVISILIWQEKKSTPVAVQITTPISAPTTSECPASTLTSAPTPDTIEGWKEYVNNKLGFSIWLPKKASLGDEFAPVKIIEDNKNNMVYIGPGIELLTKDNGWGITVKSVRNNEELEVFIKEKFGSDCKLGKKEYLYNVDDNDIYNIEAMPGEMGMESNCPLNYVYKILYNAGLKKAMAVAIGQECRFSATIDNYGAVCYDELIIDSFRFR